ncbi:outer membrane protein assembly factor BamD [Parasaccharibacter sp. TMW2.1882]|uniref:Outer membrane protein assembly factor BamD n=3 Tax=Acetobacterales TaxID=3120395 RepID=A0A7U7J113_9PROT|nr:outer membrane protein assembly factor BamD [Bombella apis]MCK8636944.1 outer membrane protein assembly factor BamD [Parasaccharibacter sp. TMW2.1885]MCL1495944.1 outer membrane protein assembly factor BamD [Parasaccharibacter sp. TMW2.1882]MCL1513601.1 outer membrane protein assembly factor BamD [Parasaccharibacter sp. TMW 2.1891]MCL1515142.1 outer membrane protein assembly factor BamD [Parasaccharibacter sp. TMW2.1890]MUH02954.1 outer membrane protein assembly factor BamD [Bombella sp. ES
MVSSILKFHMIPSRFRLPALGAPALLGLALLSGCSSSDADIQAKLPRTADAETLYNYGIDALHGGHYKLASSEFELLQQNFPYSGYTGSAELMEGYAYYLQGEYALSVQQLERYLQLHPTSPDAAYAYYLRGLCYYEQIGDVSRDQLGTLEAMDALQEVITRFPQTSYARDAQLKIDLCRDHLAGKEMYVGRYYQREKDYQAAYGRYQRVIQDFQTTNHVPEALERLVEVNLALGLPDEARQAAAVLGYNAPDSRWYRLAYNKLKYNHQLTPQLPKPSHAQKKHERRSRKHRDGAAPPVQAKAPVSPDSVIVQPVSTTQSAPVASVEIPPVPSTAAPGANQQAGGKKTR